MLKIPKIIYVHIKNLLFLFIADPHKKKSTVDRLS
jgi:hypothetical protein